jgi:predicted dehydrogenase
MTGKCTHSNGVSRRRFAQLGVATAGALAVPFIASRNVYGANERLNIAAIGVGGMGEDDVGYCKDENIVALCDVDDNNAAETFKAFPKARRYRDFRVMLEKEGSYIDAVTVSTPDHIHFHAATAAINLGKHVYVQKPLTHSVWEARTITALAREKKVITQMGIQGHSHKDSRRLVELIRSGVLGDVTEVHAWTDRPTWPQGIHRPPHQRVPNGLDWNLWLGPSPWRDYHAGCVPFKWRGFWDFGSGALGDMGCHVLDLAFFALGLREPVSIEAASSAINSETAPKWSIIKYLFIRPGDQPLLKLVWYDGRKTPPASLIKNRRLSRNGSILIGTKDTLYVPSYWGAGEFLSGARMADFRGIPQTLPRFAGDEDDYDTAHHREWLNACKGEGEALASFDYSGPMTEAVLLGNVALRTGKPITWDAKNCRVSNSPEANQFIRREYREAF